MENQSDDQPLKWIERIKHGLFTKGYFACEELLPERIFKGIFSNIRERTQKGKKIFLDFDVSLDNKEYLFRQTTSKWKLIPKNSVNYGLASNLSNYNIPNNSPKTAMREKNQAEGFPILKELQELKIVNDKLSKRLDQGLIKQDKLDPVMIETIINCNNILIKIIASMRKNWMDKRSWKKQENIEKYKREHSWIEEKEWEKLSFFTKITKRWNFTDMHQCLIPWEEKKLSIKELQQFWEKKREWRVKRLKELENKPLQRQIFDKFCHARKIGNKIIYNLDKGYTDSFSNTNEGDMKRIIQRKN